MHALRLNGCRSGSFRPAAAVPGRWDSATVKAPHVANAAAIHRGQAAGGLLSAVFSRRCMVLKQSGLRSLPPPSRRWRRPALHCDRRRAFVRCHPIHLGFNTPGPCLAAASIPNADVGVARQPMPPPRFEIDCEKTNDAPALLHARQPRATIVCPANCSTAARSAQGGEGGIYQRDSSICKAAIHAGALGAAGGNVTVYFQPLLRSWNNYMEGWCMHSGALFVGWSGWDGKLCMM